MSRAQAVVIRNNKILMVNQRAKNDSWWCLPGGGIESGETPENAVLRELAEECNVKGKILRKLAITYKSEKDFTASYLIDIGNQVVQLGYDPEHNKTCYLADFKWFSLNEISEIDRAFLFNAGIIEIDGIAKEVMSWEREISYPSVKESFRGAFFENNFE